MTTQIIKTLQQHLQHSSFAWMPISVLRNIHIFHLCYWQCVSLFACVVNYCSIFLLGLLWVFPAAELSNWCFSSFAKVLFIGMCFLKFECIEPPQKCSAWAKTFYTNPSQMHMKLWIMIEHQIVSCSLSYYSLGFLQVIKLMQWVQPDFKK